ncbi:hypothetical protein OPIT5_08150 [Opitutaceae bacterium TAV5]|nr:hypothetical protein OPIT5_08150 [Opitutaceae bacterium TAV5]
MDKTLQQPEAALPPANGSAPILTSARSTVATTLARMEARQQQAWFAGDIEVMRNPDYAARLRKVTADFNSYCAALDLRNHPR